MRNAMVRLDQELDTVTCASRLARAINDGGIIFLEGALGAGKTTFARGFMQGLGYLGKVKSPSYTIVEPYHIHQWQVIHIDLYRIHEPVELSYLGITDYFSEHTIGLIEWPERGLAYLPQPDLICQLTTYHDSRELFLSSASERGEQILSRFR